ncbi:DUF4249 domain-containing protein [Emticicia sp. 17c]|uniref:DUF4249 domain-containing protein n=1 Tax=Emticicia sp. 17c TaxID=3127704 RepID=UPI00301E2481
MKGFITKFLVVFFLWFLSLSCIDRLDYNISGRLNVVVVDGRITDIPTDEQLVRINRSKANEYNGRFGSTPISEAKLELVINGGEVVPFTEKKDIAGTYILPHGFAGKVGQSYQLRIQLKEGTQYESSIQVMPAVPKIEKLSVAFNPTNPFAPLSNFRGTHDFYLDTQDPADEHNYYSWEWDVYEKQDWCRTCVDGVYAVNNILPGQNMFYLYYVSGNELYEDCFNPSLNYIAGYPPLLKRNWYYDYLCRTKCWEILHNQEMNIFDDINTNGGKILGRKVAQIPFYQRVPCLAEIRQTSLTSEAFLYYQHFQEQISNAGGVADTPPTALIGNIHNIANPKEAVVGFFTASSVAKIRYWLDRKDTDGVVPPGLFMALHSRAPVEEPAPPDNGYIMIWGGPPRVPTALCLESESRTANKPEGWQDY